MLAKAMDKQAGVWDGAGLRRELAELGQWTGAREESPSTGNAPLMSDAFRLASWRELLDAGVMQDGEPFLAATARPVVALISEAASKQLGSPATITVGGPTGSVTLTVEIADVIDDVVFLPMHSTDCSIYRDLGARIGSAVDVSAGGAA
jgi:NADH-quinone oxidoreductase subunit G